MNYEEKYNKALERAKKFEEKYGGDYAGYIFPELAESEDERIRRKMLEHFRSKTKETWCNMPVKNIIAYLEKQKEQKSAEWSEEDERILKGIIGLVDHNQHYNVSNKEMLAWLKSLKPSWKPSEEQDAAHRE